VTRRNRKRKNTLGQVSTEYMLFMAIISVTLGAIVWKILWPRIQTAASQTSQAESKMVDAVAVD
jgi:hypothetical protein